MNKIIISGRLAKDPKLRAMGMTGTSVCEFSVAVDRGVKREGKPSADFFVVKAFGRRGEVINQYFKKGQQIILNGRIESSDFTDKDGIKRRNWEVLLDEFDFVGSKKDNDQQNGGNKQQQSGGAFDDDFYPLDDEVLPF